MFSRSQPVLQSETGRETLPDNPSFPAPQDLIPPLFARALISKKNTDFMSVCACVATRGEKLNFKTNRRKKKRIKQQKQRKEKQERREEVKQGEGRGHFDKQE